MAIAILTTSCGFFQKSSSECCINDSLKKDNVYWKSKTLELLKKNEVKDLVIKHQDSMLSCCKGRITAEITKEISKSITPQLNSLTKGINTLKAKSDFILYAVVPPAAKTLDEGTAAQIKSASTGTSTNANAPTSAPAVSDLYQKRAESDGSVIFCLYLGKTGYWPSVAIDAGETFPDAISNGLGGYNLKCFPTEGFTRDYGVTFSGTIYIKKSRISSHSDGSAPQITGKPSRYILTSMEMQANGGDFWIF